MTLAGFPHSGTPGSTPTCGSPRLFAACRALLRLSVPRHPPCALVRLTDYARTSLDVATHRSTDSQITHASGALAPLSTLSTTSHPIPRPVFSSQSELRSAFPVASTCERAFGRRSDLLAAPERR